MKHAEKLPLKFSLRIGIPVGGSIVKDIPLSRTNGVVETVFSERLPEMPYTWMGRVIAVSVSDIGGSPIAGPCRDQYDRNENITLPDEVLAIPFAEVNTILIEIHRRLWRRTITEQQCVCKFCGSSFIADIDLNKIQYLPSAEKAFETTEDWSKLVALLPYGYEYTAPKTNGAASPFDEYDGLTFNRFTYRMPNLADVIRHESLASDSVVFWRRIAADCLVEVANDEGIVLPSGAWKSMGLALYNKYLDSEDLLKIRETLRDVVPALPMYYQENCPKCKRSTPVTMEGSSFFGD